MGLVVFAAGLIAIVGAVSFWFLRSSRREADTALKAFATTVPASLTAEVEQWLRPQLARRDSYPFLGGMWGMATGQFLVTFAPEWQELPWYWLTAVIGIGAGTAVGALLAGYRTTPLVEGPARTVDPLRRRLSEYVDRARLLRLRLAVVVSVAGLALAVSIAASGDPVLGRRVVLACGLGVLLVAAHYWVAAAVVSRPMVTSTPEGLLWQRAVVTMTLKPMPENAFFAACATAAIALYATVVASRDVPRPVLAFGAGYAVLAAASVAAVVLSEQRQRRQCPTPAPPERALP